MKNKSVLVVATKSITIKIFLKEIINELDKYYNVILGSSDIENNNEIGKKKINFIFPKNLLQLLNPLYLTYCIIKNRKKIQSQNINIILLNTPLASHIIRLSCIFLKIKIVYFVHGYRFHPNGNFFLNYLFYIIEKFLSIFTTAFININNIDYQVTKKYFRKNSLLINGVGINLDKKENTYNYFKNKRNFKIGYIGAYKKNKGYEDLFKLALMFKKNPEISFDCYGYGNINYYQNKIKKLKLNNIKLNEFKKNILSIIKKFDILLSLSYREGLPVSFIECMSQGVPVICYNIRGSSDLIINDFNGYLFNKKEYKKVFNKIIYLSQNHEELSKISNNSFKFIDSKFDRKKNAKLIVQYISNV